VRLHFSDARINDDNWTVLCHSLSKHPKLKALTFFRGFRADAYSNESKTRRTDVFLKMLQANTVLQELRTDVIAYHGGFDLCILVDVIQPYFRHLPHVRAFGRHVIGHMYAKVLALALNKVDDSPTLVWMLIRDNIPTILGLQEGNEEDVVLDA
jgi:hypothetical protein